MKIRVGLFWILIVLLLHIVVKNVLDLMKIKYNVMNKENLNFDLKFKHGVSNANNEVSDIINENEKNELLQSLSSYVDNSTSYNQGSMSNMNNMVNDSLSLQNDISKAFAPENMNNEFLPIDSNMNNFYDL